jgi:3-dehydroquinate dehydratase-2
MRTFYLFSGPNLHKLGQRDPRHYGSLTYTQLVEQIRLKVEQAGYQLEIFQTNHEGELIDALYKAYDKGGIGILFNPGALTHYAYALHDAVELKTIPVVEVHLSNIEKREPWRAISVLKDVVDARFFGEGLLSYQKAVDYLLSRVSMKM